MFFLDFGSFKLEQVEKVVHPTLIDALYKVIQPDECILHSIPPTNDVS